MPTKKRTSKKQSLPKFTLKIIGLVLLGFIALLAAIVIVIKIERHLWEKQQIKKEDAIFSQMESFVNNAKARLEQEIPEGKWEIEKYCDKPGSKGTISEYNYGCYFKTISTAGLPNKDKLISKAHEIMNNPRAYKSTHSAAITMIDLAGNNTLRGCTFIVWEKDRLHEASIGCFDTTLVLRYPQRY